MKLWSVGADMSLARWSFERDSQYMDVLNFRAMRIFEKRLTVWQRATLKRRICDVMEYTKNSGKNLGGELLAPVTRSEIWYVLDV